MVPPRPRLRPSPALAIFLLAAVAFGAAASLLAAPSIPTPPTTSHGGNLSWAVLKVVIPLLVFGFFGLWLLLHFSGGRQAFGSRALLSIGVTFLLFLAFLIAAHLIGGQVAPAGGTAGNLSGGPTHQPGVVPNPPNGSFSPYLPPSLQPLALWVPYIAIFGVAGIAGLVLLPFMLRRRSGETDTTATTAARAKSSFQSAIQDLDADPAADVRSRIIAAYARLLHRIDATGVEFETLTPKEIEVECTVRLGISPPTAQELTSLFEEARYSTHALADRDLDRARTALQQALSDLDRPRLFA